MRLRTVVFGTGGLLATTVAVFLIFVPTVAGESLVAVFGRVAPTTTLLVGSLTVGVCAVLAGWLGGLLGGGSPTTFDVAVDSPPEAVTATESRLVAADIDAAIDDAVAGDDAAMDTVTERLTAAATTASAIGAGVSQASAHQAVRAGTWTDDAVAAAMLSPTEPQSLLARLRLWLDPESERRRRIRRTVDAIERASGGER
ncbi:hypothetical protein Har1130_13170 [Haloarcula sp. CBA1130]|uniref:DUF7269 family protein n=1 Tax=unclassified Haloarcula TaxID=2624677 RepID=UPI00124569F8|nr:MULTISPECIES: hypothetical protein [unclassified Haloarcula]KAA9399150.1 hypothetical protein Har1129_13270 [Haloarcula sp. CBA1129]KAA9403663.1 hypothetical protein Har1130_13170 [Haloarcula sp. CBA1130]